MRATSQDIRTELDRGTYLLKAMQELIPDVSFRKVSNTKFDLSDQGGERGSFVWRLGDNGVGVLKWRPNGTCKDFARRRNFTYDFMDEVSDIPGLAKWILGIIQDLGSITGK